MRLAHARWARAVELGGQGRYAAAETILRDLRTGPGVPAVLRAHAMVTRASHLRQTGDHARATRFDGEGARLARPPAGVSAPEPGSDRDGTGAAAALGDALTGLAADAIGRLDAAGARRLLDRAAPWCGVPDDGVPGGGVPGGDPPVSRTAVRWLWVRAEAGLLTGDADGAVRASATARGLAEGLGSPRHVVKSRLVHAVARIVAGDPVPGELDAVVSEAGSRGLVPLRWAALMAGGAPARDTPVAVENARPGDGTVGPNGRHAGESQVDTLGRQTVAQSRRHAMMSATNVIYLRSDPVIRLRLRE